MRRKAKQLIGPTEEVSALIMNTLRTQKRFFFGFPPVPFVRFYAHRFCPEHFIFSLIISFAIFLSNYEYTYLYFSYSLFLTRSLFLFSLYCVHSAKTIPHSFQVVLHPLNVHGENTTWLNPCLAWPSLTC